MKRLLIFLILCVGAVHAAIAQTDADAVDELERKRKAALQEIEQTSSLLEETKTSARNSLHRLNLLTQQLQTRKKFVALLGQEVTALNKKIDALNNEIALLDKDLLRTKANYARSMQNQLQEYRTSQYKMLIILSAENLAQSYRRMRYLREYADWQKDEAMRIQGKQEEINHRKAEVEKSLKSKQTLLEQRERENKKLIDEENEQRRMVKDLNSQKKTLLAQLQQKKNEADALNRRLDALIAEDMQASADAGSGGSGGSNGSDSNVSDSNVSGSNSSNASRSGGSARSIYKLSESELNLSNDFSKNKGALPYPLTGRYSVVSHFGEHQHQELSQVRMNNDGIDIQTTAGAEALAVFKGVVTRVFIVPGFNNNVIIRHGNYLTVYSNLSQVYVKAGDVVSTRQAVGKIFTDDEKGNETILHFQIWKDRSKQNPEAWLRGG